MMAAMGIVQPIVQPGGAPNTGQLLQPAVSATMQLNLQSDVAEQQITEGDLAPATYALHTACTCPLPVTSLSNTIRESRTASRTVIMQPLRTTILC